MKWINLGLAILIVIVVWACLDIPDEITIADDVDYCLEYKPCAPEGMYMHRSRDYCVACMQCIDGIWQEIDCGDFPWE